MTALTIKVVLQGERGISSPVILDRASRPIIGQETKERLSKIAAGLKRLPGVSFMSTEIKDDQLDSTLGAVHSLEYLEFLSNWSGKLSKGEMRLDDEHCAPGVAVDTPIVPGIYEVAREGARTAIEAAQRIANGGRFAYALCRPPGHHAGRDWLGGYCYLNNSVIAVRTLLDAGIERVAVIDFDYHFGNGSAALLEQVPEVFYGSIHSSTEISYPYMKTLPPNHRQVYVSFLEPPTPNEFLVGIEHLLEESSRFGAAAMVVSVGYDIIAGDPHGTWGLRPSIVKEIAEHLSKTSLPLCMVQEGGYSLSKLEECAFAFGAGLLGESHE